MYHIKKDKRAERSAKNICTALIELMKKKPYYEISVTDIQQAAGVGRSTFYRNFDTPDDILLLMCNNAFDDIFSNSNGLLTAVNCFNYWFDNSEILEALMKANRVNYFADSFKKHLMESNFDTKHKHTDADYQYQAAMISYAMVGALTAWIERGRVETKAEMFKYVVNSIRGIKPILSLKN